jgi:deazaflavin-dependent oxidoreductase (nitroreductase family)
VAVVASQGGQPTHPAWFHNLKAHPGTTIELGSEVREVRARVASDEERDRMRPRLSAVYPGSDFFQHLAKGRKIPIVILEPREAVSTYACVGPVEEAPWGEAPSSVALEGCDTVLLLARLGAHRPGRLGRRG